MKPNISTSIVLETRTPKVDRTYPIKLRVTYLRKQKYYSLGKSITEEDFQKVIGNKPRGDLKDLKIELGRIEEKATSIIDSLENFSFQDFENKFLRKNYTGNILTELFNDYIDKLLSQRRLKTAISYQSAIKSLKLFSGDKEIALSKIDSRFLSEYEHWMLDKKNSKTTVGFYLRCLRSILNVAIAKGLYDREKYPFGKNKYIIPKGANIKKALTKQEIRKIQNYKVDLRNLSDSRYKDYWMFTYYCNGINIKDMARLKFKNIHNDSIIVTRAKTENSTRGNQKPIVIALLPEAKKIISKWGNPNEPGNFVFPILTENITPEQEMKIVAQTVQNINKTMKRVKGKLKISVPVTTYVARHSFATILKRGGAPIEFISESLGHSNVMTTESYLGSFDDGTRKKFAKLLVG